ncbi:MAG: hypothetical protein Q8K55_09060 [Gemmatimonadaceae bacterium]|nr:hypothetical protein [Gemmatimonadaceae bacterium]
MREVSRDPRIKELKVEGSEGEKLKKPPSVSEELMAVREQQKAALKVAWEKIFREYFNKTHEYPPLKINPPNKMYGNDERGQEERKKDEGAAWAETMKRVQQFMGTRTAFARGIKELKMIEDMVEKIAIEVLDDLTLEQKK